VFAAGLSVRYNPRPFLFNVLATSGEAGPDPKDFSYASEAG
jgi:hypothetical protein